MAVEEVAFGFDTGAFEAGINKVVQSLGRMEKSFVDTSKKMTKSFSSNINPIKAVGKALSGIGGFIGGIVKQTASLTGAFILFKGAVSAARTVLEEIPEIGKTFNIVKDIFFRNLLFPIRQQLLPILQKVIDWTRNNRTAFVKWGAFLVNVFKVVTKGVTLVVRLLSSFFRGFTNTFKRIFGLTAKSVGDIANIVIFKIAAVLIFLQTTLEPVFARLGELFATLLSKISKVGKEIFDAIMPIFQPIIDLSKEFGKGFVEGFNEIFGSVDDNLGIMDSFRDVMQSLSGVIQKMLPFAKTLGKIMGRNFAASLKISLEVLKSVFKILAATFELIKSPANFKEIFKNLGSELFESGKEIGGTYGKAVKGGVKDVIGLFKGKPEEGLKTEIPPKDTTLLPTANQNINNNKKTEINISLPKVTVVAENPTQTANDIVKPLEQKLTELNKEDILREGG